MKKQKGIKIIVLTTIIAMLILIAIVGTYAAVQEREPFICYKSKWKCF